jgi:hypothetical protein
MATTTNFGWETPDDTDLVKDGALSIRTLGSSIDTSFVDLKGGTTGQVLAKATNTDLDFTWVAQDDSNAIQNAIVDAKGDLISATAADTPARLAVGTNGHVLTADSSTSTGLKWAAVSAPSAKAFRAYRATAQTLTSATFTKIQLATETFDTDNWFDSTTNYRFTPQTAGYYRLSANITFNASTRTIGMIYKNGTEALRFIDGYPMYSANGTDVFYMNGTTDYIELYAYVTGGSLQVLGDTTWTVLSGEFIGA